MLADGESNQRAVGCTLLYRKSIVPRVPISANSTSKLRKEHICCRRLLRLAGCALEEPAFPPLTSLKYSKQSTLMQTCELAEEYNDFARLDCSCIADSILIRRATEACMRLMYSL